MALKLIEYAYNGTHYVASGTLTIDPSPNTIEQEVKVEWRVKSVGLYAIFPRAKHRYRRTIGFSIKGGCTLDKRTEIEFYALRNSKFKLDYVTSDWSNVPIPEPFSDRNIAPAGHPWNPAYIAIVTYVVFDDVSFTFDEGKSDWITYTIKFKVVSDEGIA